MTIQDLYDKRQQTVVTMRDLGKAVESGTYTAEQNERFNKLDGELKDIDNQIVALKRLKELDTEKVLQEGKEQQRSDDKQIQYKEASPGEQRKIWEKVSVRGYKEVSEEERAIYNQAERETDTFTKFFRHGLDSLTQEERSILHKLQFSEKRAQSTTTTAGGYTIPQGFSYEIDKQLQTISELLNWARIMRTDTGNDIPWPTNNDTSNTGELLAENGDASSSSADLVFGQVTLKAYKFSSKLIKSSSELIQDNAVNLPEFIAEAFAERVGKIENSYYTTGTGSSQPLGYTDGTAGFVQGFGSTVSNSFNADDLIDLMHSVDAAYRNSPKAAWAFNDLILAQIKKMSNSSTDDRPLWLPSIRDGAPDTLYGKPYFINNAMASAVADQAKVIYFGDWRRLVIRRVNNFTIKRMDERYGEFDQVAWVGFSRSDSKILNRNAVKYLKCT